MPSIFDTIKKIEKKQQGGKSFGSLNYIQKPKSNIITLKPDLESIKTRNSVDVRFALKDKLDQRPSNVLKRLKDIGIPLKELIRAIEESHELDFNSLRNKPPVATYTADKEIFVKGGGNTLRTGAYYKETPIGAIDGSNLTYNLTYQIQNQLNRLQSLVEETPEGEIDGINRTYYLSFVPSPFSFELQVNGVTWTESVDYSLNRQTKTITLEAALNPNDYPVGFTFKAKYATVPLDRLVVNGVEFVEGTDYTKSTSSITLTTALNPADYPPNFPFTFQYVIDTSGFSDQQLLAFDDIDTGHVEFSEDFSDDFY